jgi:D-glycero-alpha-D-manno-heptose 1-phosphate guanylyltransferase
MSDICIILAGGLGTRLRSLLPDAPKCLAPVGGRTFLELQLEMLAEQGVTSFVLSLGHLAEKVMMVADGLRARYAVDWVVEPSPLGTGGAILYAMDEKNLDEVLIANGDTLLLANLAALRAPLDAGEAMRIAAVAAGDRTRFGGLDVRDGRVTGFLEKGTSGPGLINAGFYRLSREVFGGFAPGAVFSLETQVLPGLVRQGALTAAVLDGRFIDIGVPDDFRRLQDEFA